MNTWYAINKTADKPDEAEVMIYDEIGSYGVGAAAFAKDLKAIKAGTIHVRINSPGGSVFEGTAIHNSLKAHPANIIVHVDGLAASAGSFIAVAGDEVRMASNAYMMIHNSAGGIVGGADDMRAYAELLDKINDTIAGMYSDKSGKDRTHWRNLMDAETWFTAEEAKAEGLIDAIDGAKESKATASFDFKIYNKVPDAVLEAWAQNQINTPDAPSRDEPSPVLTQETPSMGDTSTTTAPAQTPAAGAGNVPQGIQSETARLNDASISNFIEKGKIVGRTEGRNALMDEIRSIVAACPGRAQTALNAILSGQNSSTVKLIVDAEVNAEINANKRAQEQDLEIAKLRAEQARLMELGAIGGHSGVAVSVFAPAAQQSASAPSGLEPAAQAELEWSSDPMVRANNGGEAGKSKWLLYRTNQLNGCVRVLKTA